MRNVLLSIPILLCSTVWASSQALLEGFPESYAETIKAATEEGAVKIYTTTDIGEMGDLLDAFKQRFPGISVEYIDSGSAEIYNKVTAETATGQTADLIWSSTMNLIMDLVETGYAAEYESPVTPMLPDWAKYKNLAYGTTSEPLVFAYNKRLVPPEDVPATRADIIKLATEKTDAYRGKITMSAVSSGMFGYMVYTSELKKDKDGTLALLGALGKAEVKTYNGSGTLIEKLASGEHVIGLNLIGSYLSTRQKTDPNLGLIFPSDYTTVMSRVAFVPHAAKNPNAGRLFLDFLLSKEGQTLLTERSMFPVRTDMSADTSYLIPGQADVPSETFYPIAIDTALSDSMKPDVRVELLDQYKKLTGTQ